MVLPYQDLDTPMKTINLLPPKVKRSNQLALSLKWLRIFITLTIILSGLYAGLMSFTLNWLRTKNLLKIHEIDQLTNQIVEHSSIEKNILLINNRLDLASQVAKTAQEKNWQEILLEIAKYTPETIKLGTLNLRSEVNTPLAQITGVGANRRVVIEYQLALESSPLFEEVKIISMGSATVSGDTQAPAVTLINFSINLSKEYHDKKHP